MCRVVGVGVDVCKCALRTTVWIRKPGKRSFFWGGGIIFFKKCEQIVRSAKVCAIPYLGQRGLDLKASEPEIDRRVSPSVAWGDVSVSAFCESFCPLIWIQMAMYVYMYVCMYTLATPYPS